MQANSVAHRQESPKLFKGFIWATLSPSQCCRNPLVLLLPLLFGDMEETAGGDQLFWERRPFFGAKIRWWEDWAIQGEQSLLRGWQGMGLPSGVWRSWSIGFVGGTWTQEDRMGGASWALNVSTTQGTRARTRHGQRVYLRKLKM